MGMKIWKTPKPIEYSYSLGIGCCNEAKKYSDLFRVSSNGKVYWEVKPERNSSESRYYTEDVVWEKCPFCGEPFELTEDKKTKCNL